MKFSLCAYNVKDLNQARFASSYFFDYIHFHPSIEISLLNEISSWISEDIKICLTLSTEYLKSSIIEQPKIFPISNLSDLDQYQLFNNSNILPLIDITTTNYCLKSSIDILDKCYINLLFLQQNTLDLKPYTKYYLDFDLVDIDSEFFQEDLVSFLESICY